MCISRYNDLYPLIYAFRCDYEHWRSLGWISRRLLKLNNHSVVGGWTSCKFQFSPGTQNNPSQLLGLHGFTTLFHDRLSFRAAKSVTRQSPAGIMREWRFSIIFYWAKELRYSSCIRAYETHLAQLIAIAIVIAIQSWQTRHVP